MAGKKKLDTGPMLLTGLDLDDIDDFLEPKSTGKMTPKEAVRKFESSAKKGFRARINTQSLLSSFARTALPEGYVRLLGLYDETRQGVEHVVRGIEDTEAAALENLAGQFEDHLPKLKDKLPDAVYERIKAKLADKKDQYKFQRQFDQARNKSANPEGDLEREGDSTVDQMFNELSEAQLDLEKANGEIDHRKLEYDVKKDGIRAKLDKHRFDALNRSLGLIADATTRQSAFNDNITYQYQRKSLELSMRSYLALRSLVRAAGETHQLHRDAYTALVHNTSLPEHRKTTEAERTKFNAKQAVLNPFKNAVNKTASDFATSFLPQLFNNVGSKGASVIRGAGEAGEGLLGTLLRRLMADPVGNAGELAGDGLGRALEKFILPTVSRRVRPTVQRFSDKYTGGLDSRISYGLDNIAALSQHFANDASKSTGMLGYLQDAVKMFAPQFKLNDLIKDNTYQTIEQGASFNQMTQRSIVEIIPGYLSRILQETRMIRTGDHTIDRETYDITRGQFVGLRTSQDNLSKRIIGRGARQSMRFAMSETMGAMDSKESLSPEAKHALEERLLRDAMEGRHFDPVAYVRAEGYAPGTDAEVLAELERFFKRKFKFDSKGELAKNARNFRRRQEFSVQFNNLRDSVRSPIGEIERLLKSGNHTALRELGIIHTIEGEDRINYARVREYYRDLGDEQAPQEMPNLTDPLFSRLRADLDKKGKDAKERFKRTRGRFKTTLADVRGKTQAAAGDYSQRAKHAYEGMALNATFNIDDVKGTYSQTFKTGYAKAQEQKEQLSKTVTDLISVGSQTVVLKADEIASGELIDVTTQKAITQIDDIKGQVIDKWGNTRVSAAEAATGLMTLAGQKLKLVPHTGKLPSNVLSLIHQQRTLLGQQLTQEDGPLSRVKDVYLLGSDTAVLKASAMRAGEYINTTTGDIVETIDDLTGNIAHIRKPDEVLLTEAEVRSQLVDNTGKQVKSSRLWRGLKAMLGGSATLTKHMFKIAKGVLKFTSYAIGKRLLTLDAYLPGSTTPVLTSSKLKRGEYYDSNGNVLRSFDDLRDGVFNPDGNMLVSPDEVAALVNRDGSKHTAAKKRSALRKMVKRAIVGGAKAIGRKWWSGTKAYYKKLGGGIMGAFGRGAARADRYNEQGVSNETIALHGIIDVLERRLPKEGPKKGSAEWQLAQMENGRKQTPDRETKKETKETKGLAGLIGSLFGRKGRDDDSDDEDGGDTNIHIEGGGGDSDKSKKRRKPKGKMGRFFDKIKRSRIGGALGRVAGGLGGIGRGAMLLGSGSLLSGGAALLGGLGTAAAGAGAAVLGVLSSPVVLGALAAGAIAYGGYKVFQRIKNTSGDFRELRLMQYGVVGTSDKLKVLRLEAYLEQFTSKGPDPKLNLSAAKPKEIFDILKVDPADGEALRALGNWLEYRFKPVFFTYLKAMNQLTPANTLLNELDDKLPDGAKFAFAEALQAIPAEAYQHHQTPFNHGEDVKAAVNPEDITHKLNALKSKWKGKHEEQNKEGPQERAKDKAGQVKSITTAVSGMAIPAIDKVNAPGKAGIGDLKTQPTTMDKAGARLGDLIKATQDSWVGKAMGRTAAASPVLLVGMKLMSSVASIGKTDYSKLTALQAIRVRAYGRLSLDSNTVSALFETEALLYKGIRFTQEGQAYYDGNLDELIGRSANLFGINVTNAQDGNGQAFVDWLLHRFIPVGLAYFAAARQYGKGVTPSRIESALNDDARMMVINAIMAASVERNGDQVSIWDVDTFFDNEVENPNQQLKKRAEMEKEVFAMKMENAKFSSPGTSAREKKTGMGALWDKLKSGLGNVRDTIKEKMGNVVQGIKESIGGAINQTKEWLGLKPKPQTPGQSVYGGSTTPGGTLEQSGAVFTGFAQGNGGVWDTIPLPKANRSREAAMETLRAVQQFTGVDAELLATFCSIESNFDYLVKAKTSSATGWFQFINATWDEQLRKHGATYGIPPDNKDRYLRKDPRINALMGAEFLKGNYRYLASKLGRAPTDTDLYCAHFMGAGGAAGFLQRDRNANAAALYPKEAAANRSIYYKPTGQPRTVGEVYALFEAKVSKHRRGGTGTDVGKSPVGEPDAQKIADAQAAAVAKDTDFKEVTPDEVGGEVMEGSTAQSPMSINMVADRAAAPMRSTVPQSSRGAPATPVKSGNPTTVTSGRDDERRAQAMEADLQRAARADQAAAEAVKHRQATTEATIGYQERQLETQIQMRDLLKMIAERMPKSSGTTAPRAAPPSAGNNDMGTPQTPTMTRKPGNKPLPISFQR